MKIGSVELGYPLILAPMAGVTDVGFRAVCCDYGADATVSEMLSVRAMAHNPQKTQFMTLSTASEKVKIAQIFGHEPQFMELGAKSPLLEKFDGLDINMGCPAPKVVKNGEGAALMDNVPLAGQIVRAVVAGAGGRPVSVKFRKGCKQKNFLEFARMCEECGASFITFHGRTVAEGYSGHSDWDALAAVKAAAKIPVVGSGDVVDGQSFAQMKKTGVDGVMIGRGALGKPWIFAELKNQPVQNRFAAIEKHIQILRENFEDGWLKLYIRKHLLWYAKDLPLASSVRAQLAQCEDLDLALEILRENYAKIEK